MLTLDNDTVVTSRASPRNTHSDTFILDQICSWSFLRGLQASPALGVVVNRPADRERSGQYCDFGIVERRLCHFRMFLRGPTRRERVIDIAPPSLMLDSKL